MNQWTQKRKGIEWRNGVGTVICEGNTDEVEHKYITNQSEWMLWNAQKRSIEISLAELFESHSHSEWEQNDSFLTDNFLGSRNWIFFTTVNLRCYQFLLEDAIELWRLDFNERLGNGPFWGVIAINTRGCADTCSTGTKIISRQKITSKIWLLLPTQDFRSPSPISHHLPPGQKLPPQLTSPPPNWIFDFDL